MVQEHCAIYHPYSGLRNDTMPFFFHLLETYEWTGIGLVVEERILEVKVLSEFEIVAFLLIS